MNLFADYAEYILQIDAIRASFVGASNRPKLDSETLKYYLKLKLLGLAYVGVQKAQHTKFEKEIKDYYKTLKKYGDNVGASTSLAATTERAKVTNPDHTSGMTSIPKINVPDHITKLYTDLEKQGKINEKFFTSNNINNYKSGAFPIGMDAFPEPGQPVEGHSNEYGPIISSQENYVIGGNDSQSKQVHYKGWARVPKGTLNGSANPQSPLEERIAEMLEAQAKETPGSYKFFIEKLHGKSFAGNFFKKNIIKKGLTAKDLPNRMVFPAYISKFNDSYAVAKETYNFIGRGEPVYIYKQTTRNMTLEFSIISDFSASMLMAAMESEIDEKKKQSNKPGNNSTNKRTTHSIDKKAAQNLVDGIKGGYDVLSEEEKIKMFTEALPDWGDGSTPNPIPKQGQLTGFVPGQLSGTPEMLWERITFLSQCCYAWYRKDGKMKEQPMVRIRIGDIFDIVGMISDMSFTEDEFDLDLNPSVTVGAIPTIVTVTMNLDIIHEDEATSEYRRFYHRRDYDEKDNKWIADSGKQTSTFKDSALDNSQSKSPLSERDSLSDHGKGPFQFPAAALAQQEELKGNNSQLDGLKKSSQDNFQKGFETYQTQGKKDELKANLKDLSSSGANLNDVKKKLRLKNVLTSAKQLLELKGKLDSDQVKDAKGFVPNVAPDLSNVSTSPKKKVPKTEDIPLKKEALFPQFKAGAEIPKA